MTADLTHTLRYRTTRLGVWRFYWRSWRARLWRIHFAFALIGGSAVLAFMPGLRSIPGWLTAFAVFLFVIVAMSAALPLIRFKSAERILTVNQSGWSTRVGTKSGTRGWRQTLPVYEQPGSVVIPSNNSTALVIPNQAFPSEAQRRQFIEDVGRWQSHVA